MGEAAVRPNYLQDLLTVGCRAQRAFCRPYPKVTSYLRSPFMPLVVPPPGELSAHHLLPPPGLAGQALVGTVDRLDFDINDSVCELTIRQDLSENATASADEDEAESIIYCP